MFPPSTHQYHQQHSERGYPTLGLDAHKEASSFASGRLGVATDLQKALSSMESNATLQDDAKALRSTVDGNVVGRRPEEKVTQNQNEEKDVLKRRTKKLVKLRSACRSLVDPCMRFS